MLTDYHVHLRPDDLDARAEAFFEQSNAERYRTVAQERGIAELGVSEHVYRFSAALNVWRHPFWRQQAVDDLDAYCDFVGGATDMRLGIEADFIPGREDQMANLLDGLPFDYVIGSVHFVGDAAVDDEAWDIWGGAHNADGVWRRYFEMIAAAAASGLYDVIAHPDLVKIWGASRPRPEGDLRRYYEPAVQAIAEAGIAVEVSTAGLRKPVSELYPGPDFLELCAEAGCPVALSSDAHVPAELGFAYDKACAELERVGIAELCVFERRRRRMEPLG